MSASPECYRVTCRQWPSPRRTHALSASHPTLASALEALLDHQQRGWDSVSLEAGLSAPAQLLNPQLEMPYVLPST
jgi:hypothetical protein